ncbi:radical SAM family heme chaperone HemW [Altibacter sp.]|uniref:radical SAM family heme chaperone HemW n=1 Tax=Altibacter sp. TaxID=2024823 RepID=UPI000C97B344|nr:radical SAM family heme chaperone HemW [Altibacter sp.]MAP55505.1 coproporphyrinogen III oxidase [Altibacter sp.]
MAGIYIHIPFCKQACHYCDFHFSTSLKKKDDLLRAIRTELALRKKELPQNIETIYFGGGTPSLLSKTELQSILDTVYENYVVTPNPEITLEANPDDLSEETLQELSETAINRLSIGVQSFFEEDLKLMNRAHNASEALTSIELAKQYFSNVSIDLIYGIPGMSLQRWEENLQTALSLDVPHLSCYALTVEPRTALESFIKKGIVAPVDDAVARTHYDFLVAHTEAAGYENYEFSNFGMPGFHSRNNTAYWHGKMYLGVGPSAHSYDGNTRSWNINNNSKYIQKIGEGILPIEREQLTTRDKYNEYVMTRLRTHTGASLKEIEQRFGSKYREYALQQAEEFIEEDLLTLTHSVLKVTPKGKFLSDGIASGLFLVNLDS